MKFSKWIKPVAGILILAGLVYSTGLHDILASLSNITLPSILVLGFLSCSLIVLSAVKWQLFLRRLGNSPSLLRLCNLYLVGYFVNLIMPSYVGGDVVRTLYVAKSGEKHEAFSATFLERYTGLVAMVLMATVGVFISKAVTPQIEYLVLIIAAGLFVGSWVAFTSRGQRLVALLPLPVKVNSHLDRIQSALRFGVRDPGLLVQAGLLSVLFHILTVVNTMAVGYAVGWVNPPPLELCIVVPIILLIGAVPLSPQGLGIQEGAFFYFLQVVGATPDQAIAVGLVLRAKAYLLAVLGGVVWITLKKRIPSDSTTTGCEVPVPGDIQNPQ